MWSRHRHLELIVTVALTLGAAQRLQSFLSEVKATSPRSTVIVPKYFEPIAIR